MKKVFIITLILSMFTLATQAQQVVRATMNEEGQIVTEVVEGLQLPPQARDGLSPMPGFPLTFPSNTTYKPMRGLTLADLDGDGADEIIVCHNEAVNVVKGDGSILWTQSLTGGMAQYPASVADLDGDGHLEVVALCAYGNARGGFNIFNYDGTVRFAVETTNNPLICAPAIADVNFDGSLEIVFCGRGRTAQGVAPGIHVWDLEGNEIEGFPFELPSTPAFTPTLADIDSDGYLEIFAATTSVLYCISHTGQEIYSIDGQEAYKYSYQSPLVISLDDSGEYSLVGACHGDNPNHYVRNAATGEYREGWPKNVANWTYSAPTVVKEDDGYHIFAGVSGEGNVFYQYDADGNIADGFPLNLSSGIEGFISVADIDGDMQDEIITTFNLMENGNGYIRAWEMDGTEITDGFPLRPQGLTYMNGANFGDINGDGMLEIVTLSYEQNFSPDDPVIVTAYALNQYKVNLRFGCYKGSNDRSGWFIQLPPFISCNPVQNLTAAYDAELGAIVLNWDAPESGSTSNLSRYDLYKNGELITDLTTEGYDDYDFVENQTYEYFVVAIYDDGCEAPCDPITIELGDLSVDEHDNNLSIYPNPANDHILISGSDFQSAEIFNTLGQCVITSESHEINVEKLERGIYFVHLHGYNTSKQVKFIIEH